MQKNAKKKSGPKSAPAFALSPYEVGKSYLIRTVTHYLHGRVVTVGAQEIVLDNAAWIADTGRFADFLKGSPTQSLEIEPFPVGSLVIVGRGAIVDAVQRSGHFTDQK